MTERRPRRRTSRLDAEITRLRTENTALRTLLRGIGHMAIDVANDTPNTPNTQETEQ